MNAINKKFGLFHIPSIVILNLFILTYFIYKDFNIRMIYGYGILFLIILLYVFSLLSNNERRIINFSVFEKLYLILVLFILLNIFRGDTRIDYEVLTYIFAMIISSLYLCLGKVTNNDIAKSFKIILFFVLLFVTWEFINLLFPGFKYMYLPYLSEASQEYNRYVISGGYFISIGGSLTYVAYIMMLGISVLAAKYMVEKKKRYLILGFLLFFVMALLNRRGELIAMSLSILLFNFLLKSKVKKVLIIFEILFISMILINLFIQLMPILSNYNSLHRYIRTFEKIQSGEDFTSGRTILYQMAIDAFKEKPILGIGWNRFGDLVPLEFKLVHGMGVKDVHNIYLQFFCETGIVGGTLITGIILILYFKTIKLLNFMVRKGKTILLDMDYKIGIQCIVVSFFIQSFFLCTGLLDPVFSKLIFWFFYALAIKLVSVANRVLKENCMEDWTNNGINKKNFD